MSTLVNLDFIHCRLGQIVQIAAGEIVLIHLVIVRQPEADIVVEIKSLFHRLYDKVEGRLRRCFPTKTGLVIVQPPFAYHVIQRILSLAFFRQHLSAQLKFTQKHGQRINLSSGSVVVLVPEFLVLLRIIRVLTREAV